MRTVRSWSYLLALSAMLLATQPAHAGWFAQGNPICNAAGAQSDISVLADGGGGVYVVWRDERRGAGISDLYASRVDADGALHVGWPTNGLALVESGAVGRPWPVVTASGALLVGWLDTATFSVRLQRYSASGVRDASYPAAGITVPFSVFGGNGASSTILRMASDGGEGAYLMGNRFDIGEFNDPIFLTRVGATGAIASGWTSTGLEVAGSPFQLLASWRSLGLSPDGSGGVWVTETHTEEGGIGPNFYIGSQVHVAGNGALSFVAMAPNGYNDSFGQFQTHVATAVGAPGGGVDAFALWKLDGPSGPQLYLRRHLSTGTAAGAAVSAPVDLQMLADGSGGVYMLGVPQTAVRLELHRRTQALTPPPGWSSGVVLTTATSYQSISSVRADANVYVSWSNGTPGSEDLRASAVTSAGALGSGWATEGSVVSDAAGMQTVAGMAAGSLGDAYVAWSDTRAGNVDVYLGRLGPNGPIVGNTLGVGDPGKLTLAVARATPNPQSARHARVIFSLASDANANLELIDVTGRVFRSEALSGLSAGTHSMELAAHDPLPPGLYFVRLTQGAQRASARLTLVD